VRRGRLFPMASVLVIDDDSGYRSALRRCLIEAGYEVGVARTAEEGIAAVGMTPPDFIVLDLLLPGKSGLEALPELRDVAPGAKIIVISGAAHRGAGDLLAWARRQNADVVLRKPFDGETLLRVVRWLEAQPGATAESRYSRPATDGRRGCHAGGGSAATSHWSDGS